MKKRGYPNKHNFLDLVDYFYFNSKLHLITEKLGYSLYKAFIKPKFPVTLPSLQTIIKDIVISLRFLKESKILHCDLKPENILLRKNESNNVKLIDFGSSIFYNETHNHIEM